MVMTYVGELDWDCSRDSEGHREYKLKSLVKGSSLDGPANALQTPGLPVPGSLWSVKSDIDTLAYCRLQASVRPYKVLTGSESSSTGNYFEVENTFSTKPMPDCRDQQIDNPLLQPQRLSGGFTKFTEEAYEDRNGDPIANSAHEAFRGPQVEFDANRPTVTIEQHVADLELFTLTSLQDTVNNHVLWGYSERTIKLTNIQWSSEFYGNCLVYYKRIFTFELNIDTWDRDLLDEGTKVLHGHWGTDGSWTLDNIDGSPPDADNPQHFDRYLDRQGNPANVVLNGSGLPADVAIGTGSTGPVAKITVEKYAGADFLQLGIPTTIG